jgi:hypothetical protein
MWSKIYLSVLGLSLVVMAFFTFYGWSWLQSIGAPQTALDGYSFHAATSWPLLWITTCVLLLLGNAVLWATARSWAMWTTLGYFAVGVIVKYFWLERAAASFRTTHGLAVDSISLGPFLAVAIILVVSVAIFFDYFLVLRLHQKTFPVHAGNAGLNAAPSFMQIDRTPQPLTDDQVR